MLAMHSIHADMNKCMRACIRTHKYIHKYTYYTHTYIRTRCMHTYAHVHAHTHKHVHIHTHTYTYIRSYIHRFVPSYYFIPFFYYFAPFLLVWSISYLHPCGYTLNTWTDDICLYASIQCKQMLILPSVQELLLIQSFLHSLIPTDHSIVSTPKSAFSELYAKLFWDMLDIFRCIYTLHILRL